jgi:Tfp pilus assembly protein PilW
MGYDPIDTDETDSNADKEITVNEINGADMSAASNGERLGSDGSGNLEFFSPPGPAIEIIDSSSDFSVTDYNGGSVGTNETETFATFSPNDFIYSLNVTNSFRSSDLTIKFANNSNLTLVNPREGTSIGPITNLDELDITGTDFNDRGSSITVTVVSD